jgi:threonine dehydrogenase-like Zn-dependent dehydrogenase
VANRRKNPVIVLDDGGFVGGFLSSWFIAHDCPVVVVEQTTSGLRHAQKYACPVVSVAGSLVKREVESALIADSIVRAVIARSVLPKPGQIWGIAGYGAVGRALGRVLSPMKLKRVVVFDRDPALRAVAAEDGLEVVPDANVLVETSDVLFGCTGEDLTKSIPRTAVHRSGPDLRCASCGSSDSEFASWISNSDIARLYRRPDGRIGGNGFDTVGGDFAAGRYHVLNGGFPINLNRHWKSDLIEDFVLTRMLVFAGIVQALEVLSDGCAPGGRILPLNDQFEADVQQIWFDAYPRRLGQQAQTRVGALLARRSACKP